MLLLRDEQHIAGGNQGPPGRRRGPSEFEHLSYSLELEKDPNVLRLVGRGLQGLALQSRQEAAKLKSALAPMRRGRSDADGKLRRVEIRALGKKHADLSAKEIYQHRDARKLRKALKFERFANILTQEAPRRRK